MVLVGHKVFIRIFKYSILFNLHASIVYHFLLMVFADFYLSSFQICSGKVYTPKYYHIFDEPLGFIEWIIL